MRGEISRSGIHNWKKDRLVDVVMSLSIATGAIPGIRGHLEAAHAVAVASPANGGGIEAAMLQLRNLVLHPDPTSSSGHPVNPGAQDTSAGGAQDTQEEDNNDTDLVSHGDQDSNADNADSAVAVTDENPAPPGKPICRSLWRGKPCEDPATCDRAHKPLCMKEACQSSRDPTCFDWHYVPKRRPVRASNGSNAAPSSQHKGNSKRGRFAPKSKSANMSGRRMSQETERMYFKWKLSEIKLKESQLAAATYRDILVSKPTKASPGQIKAQVLHHGNSVIGHQSGTSVPVQPPVVPDRAPAPSLPSGINLGSVVAQLNAITSALAAAGILSNQH